MKNLTAFFLLFTLTGLFSVAMARNDECFDCHYELRNKVKHKAAELNCNLCHTDHDVGIAKKYDYRLKKPVNKMCQTCHKGMDVGHILANHPKGGLYDPFYPQNNFTCVTCHNPHQSKMPKLIRYDYSKKTSPYQGEVCALCHKDKYGISDNVPTPPRNGYGDPFEESESEVRTYSRTKVEAGQDLYTFSMEAKIFGGFQYILNKNGAQIFSKKLETKINLTQVLTDISKYAKDGDIVRLFEDNYLGPIQVGVAPVKQLIVDVHGIAGEAHIMCPTKKGCVTVAGKDSFLRGLRISNTSEDLFEFRDDAKREFVLVDERDLNVIPKKNKFKLFEYRPSR